MELMNSNPCYDVSILGELSYTEKDARKRPLVEWKSINDTLGGVLKARYGEDIPFSLARHPYTQGPATMPPAKPSPIGSAEQLVFTLGLMENNAILPRVSLFTIEPCTALACSQKGLHATNNVLSSWKSEAACIFPGSGCACRKFPRMGPNK